VMMRGVVLAVFLVGCGNDSPQENGHDAFVPPADAIDGNPTMCTALAGTANVTVTGATTAVFARLDAGGTLQAGPVAVATAPVSLALLFTAADPLSQNEAECCQGHSTCCTLDGVVVTSVGLPSGSELGAHPVMIDRFDSSFSISGTLTITSFSNPFDHAPGRIAGSISSSGTQVSGTFDNAFCAAILSVTI